MSLDTGAPPLHRDAGDPFPTTDTGLKPSYVRSWAALIGINNYSNDRQLKTAAADAVGMAKVLIEHHGFPPGNVFLIVSTTAKLPDPLAAWLASIKDQLGDFNEHATRDVIAGLLFTTLRERTGQDDRVVVYFAGHGIPQRGRDGRLENAQPYLMPVDAAPSQTHLLISLDAIEQESKNLPAKHVLYIFDACCAGLFGLRASMGLPRYTTELLRRRARQCLTAGTAEQYVRDRGRDDHSVFTWHLLQVLQDSRFPAEDGFLGFSRLAAEMKQRVPRDPLAGQQQIPDACTLQGHSGGEFVLSAHSLLPTVDDLIETARQLVDQVGRCLDEPFPIAFAARLWRLVLSTSTATPTQRAIAQRELGRALLLLGHTEAALGELAPDKLPGDPDAMLLRAMAQLRARRLDQAADELAALAASTAAHSYADFAACAAETARRPRGKRYALLIGVDRTRQSHQPAAAHDVEAMKRLLVTRLGFEPEAIQALTGERATRQGIANAFASYVERTQPEDCFVCYFSGKGILYRGVSVYASYDVDVDAGIAWTENDCDAAMRAIPAYEKLVITDGCHLAPITLDERAGYRFLFGCRRDEMGWDSQDDDGKPRGAFTLALERAVAVLGNTSLERLTSHAAAELAARLVPRQTPGYTGSGARPLIDRAQAWIELLELAQQSHRRFSVEQLDDFAFWLATDHGRMAPMAPLWLAVGLARVARQHHEAAIDALERSQHPSAWLPLVQAELRCGHYAAAFEHWRRWRREHEGTTRDARFEDTIARLEELLEQLRRGIPRAMIVLTDFGGSSLLQPASRIVDVLMKRWNLQKSQIKLVYNQTRDEVIDAFDRFAKTVTDAPALFLYIGPGFDGAELWLSTASDSDLVSDLCCGELRRRAVGCSNLTSAIILTKMSSPGNVTDSDLARTAPPEQTTLGRGMLVAIPHTHREVSDNAETPPDLEKLCAALVTPGSPPFTLNDWLARIDPPYGVTVRGNGDAPLLAYDQKGNEALTLVRELDQLPLHSLVARLERLAEQHELADDARLQLAIVQLQLERHDDALLQVDAAIAHYAANAANTPNAAEAHDTIRRPAEAHYWRGRVHLRPDSYGIAVHEFAAAVRHDPDHARAHRYRAEAIRRLIDTDLEQTLQASLQHYIRLGAPLGMDDDLAPPRPLTRTR